MAEAPAGEGAHRAARCLRAQRILQRGRYVAPTFGRVRVLAVALAPVRPRGRLRPPTGSREGALRGRIGAAKAAGALAGLRDRPAERAGARPRRTTSPCSRAASGTPRPSSTAAQALADRTEAQLRAARARSARLEARLGEVRTRLAHLLRERYVNGEPNLVAVILSAHGFKELLETTHYLQRVQHADARLLDVVRAARKDAMHERGVLNVLNRRRQAQAADLARRRDALAAILDGLRRRRDALASARAARQAALTRTRAGRARAQKELNKLLAARATRRRLPRRPGRPMGDPVGDRPVRVRRPEPPAQLRGRLGLLPVPPGDLARPRRLDPAGLPGLQGRAGPAGGALWAGGAGARNWVCASLV